MIMSWRSARTKRVVRSTLAAEACAADDSVDMGFYVASFLSELLTETSATTRRGLPAVRLYNVTDCKSLYDCIVKESPSIAEKRTTIDILSIRETLMADAFRWVPTEMMWGDSLTKIDKKLRRRMTLWLQKTVVTPHD